MSIAWYSKKAFFFAFGSWVGFLASTIDMADDYQNIAILVFIAIIAGFARETDAADSYWFKGNRSDGRR